MIMWYFSLILVVALLNGCAHLGVHKKRIDMPQSNDPVLQIFANGRALNPHSGPIDQKVVDGLNASSTGKVYTDMHPERSVLAYDCNSDPANWCSDTHLTFDAMFEESARILDYKHPDAQALELSWYNSSTSCKQDTNLTQEIPNFAALKGSFQLLAVANRMDLAQQDGGNWVGAEIHVAYGEVPSTGATIPQDLTVILEFELPPIAQDKFKKLAQAWIDLPNTSDSRYASALVNVLRQSGLSLAPATPTRALRVRARLNHRQDELWLLAQSVFDPASRDPAVHTAFGPANLNDQVCGDIAKDYVVKDPKRYFTLWSLGESNVTVTNPAYPIPDGYLESSATLYDSLDCSVTACGLPTPVGVCNARGDVREVLAIQQCSRCHTTETKTRFTHMANRLAGVPSVASEFLVGKDSAKRTNLHPSLVDLYYSNPDVVWPVTVKYATYSGPQACTTQGTGTVVNSFHDVARRALFLATIVTKPVSGKDRSLANVFSTPYTE
jgi:hypothetical protein